MALLVLFLAALAASDALNASVLPPSIVWVNWITSNFPSNAYVSAPESREFALYGAAVHDALNSVKEHHEYTPYVAYIPTDLEETTADAAIIAAAFKTMITFNINNRVNSEASGFYFNDTEKATLLSKLNTFYNSYVGNLTLDRDVFNKAVQLGVAAANSVWNVRSQDGFNRTIPLPYVPDFQPGKWYPRPNEAQVYPLVGYLKPLSIPSPYHFVVPPPHFNLNDPDYLADLAYTKDKGRSTNTTRTAAESVSGRFSAVLQGGRYQTALLTQLYPRFVNNIPNFDLRDFVRIQALVYLMAADSYTAVTSWKLQYNFWRPWQAIQRGADYASLYPGLAALADPTWVSYQTTPNNPEYPSGHSSTSGGLAQLLRRLTGWEAIPGGPILVLSPVPGVNETYYSVGDIEERMILSRVFGGMHLRQSDLAGARLGQQIADYTFYNWLRPAPPSDD